MLNKFQAYRVTHVYYEGNCLANRLANFWVVSNHMVFWDSNDNILKEIQILLCSDGIQYSSLPFYGNDGNVHTNGCLYYGFFNMELFFICSLYQPEVSILFLCFLESWGV